MNEEKCHLTSRQRLSVYGLEHLENALPDISLPSGQTLVLTSIAPEGEQYVVRLHPQSPHDLKRWIGVPNEAIATSVVAGTAGGRAREACCPLFVPHPPIPTDEPETLINLSSFLVSTASTATEKQIAGLQSYIKKVGMEIGIYLFQDIYVAAGATLVVDKTTQVLFARYITVEKTGVIRMDAQWSKIDCAGFRTKRPYISIDVAATKAASKAASRASPSGG